LWKTTGRRKLCEIARIPSAALLTSTYSTIATASSAAGSYTVNVALSGALLPNYTPTITNGTLTITKAALTVTANNASAVYGAAIPTLTDTIAGFVNGDNPSAVTGSASETTTAVKGSPVGTYPITVTQGTLAAINYSFAFVNGTLTVTPIGTDRGTHLHARSREIFGSAEGYIGGCDVGSGDLLHGQRNNAHNILDQVFRSDHRRRDRDCRSDCRRSGLFFFSRGNSRVHDSMTTTSDNPAPTWTGQDCFGRSSGDWVPFKIGT